MLDNNKRKSLGRGLGALLGEDEMSFDDIEQSVAKASSMVDVNLIKGSRLNPRTEFDEEGLNALAQSIKDKGVLQPILVRKSVRGYEIIAGERRWRASKLAGLTMVPIIEKDFSDKDVLEVALVENLLRKNLSAIEEAEGFQKMMADFFHTQESISQVVGKSRSHIANTLRLLSLPAGVQQMIKEDKLSAGHARALIGNDKAEDLAKTIIAKDLSVREVEALVAKQKEDGKKPKNKTQKDNDVVQIEKDLNKSLGLRIKISPSKPGGGKVVMQYASVAELDMIIDVLEGRSKKENAVFKEATVVQTTPVNNEKFSMKVVG